MNSRKQETLIVLFAFLIKVTCLVGQNAWIPVSAFPGDNRDDATGFSIGQFGYVGTGMNSGFQLTKDFWRYDPLADSWTQVADFGGTSRQYCVSFTINNTAYVL